MGNRKQPFGYHMEQGKIVIHPQESETVRFIFREYIAGASFGCLVNALKEQAIPYNQDKFWNKNMIARMLADRRYTGDNEFPAIILQTDFDAVMRIRTVKQNPGQKTAVQKMICQLSGHTATEQIEQQVLELLNGLAGRAEKLYTPAVPTGSDPCIEIKGQLENVLSIQPIDESQAKELIFKLAAAQYERIDSSKYETERLKRIFAATEPMESLDAELLKSTVASIQIIENNTVRLELKNHQMIGG